MAVMLAALALIGCKNKNESTAPKDPARPVEIPLPTNALPRLQTLRLWLGAAEITAEVALTPAQQQTGMMFRETIGENEGMLFVFPHTETRAFWMMNVSVPLSLAYIDPAGVILEIHDLQPHNTNSVVAATDQVQYVLETSQGWFNRHSVSTGTVIRTERGPLSESFTFERARRR
jgi:uncharacterized membrane protein (UPF0127 family)